MSEGEGGMFEEVSLREIIALAKKRKGRFSKPIIQDFLDTGKASVRIKIEDAFPERKPEKVFAVLKAFLRVHPEYHVEVVMKAGQVFLINTDKVDQQQLQ